MEDVVGKMIDTLGFGDGFEGGLARGLMVESVGMRAERSHFSPTEAMEETWAMIWGSGVTVEDEAGLVGMELRTCFRAGKPHRPIRSCSSGSNWPGI